MTLRRDARSWFFGPLLIPFLLPAALAAQTTTANIAVPELSEHAPGAAAIRRSDSNELRLFAVTAKGLSERHFLHVPGRPELGWFAWRHDGSPESLASAPAQWRRFLPVTSGWASGGTDVLGFFGFPENPPGPTEMIGIPRLTSRSASSPPYATDFHWQVQSAPSGLSPDLFNPQSIASGTSSTELDVFGTNSTDGSPGGTTDLLVLHGHQSGPGTWSFLSRNAGQPTIGGSRANVVLGPHSTSTAVFGQKTGPAVTRHLVFVKAALGSDHVTFAQGDTAGGTFSWGADLGAPRVGQLVDGPLVVTWDAADCPTCAPFKRIGVWVTGFDRNAGRFVLSLRYFDARPNVPSDPTDVSQWTAWQSFGSPAGLAGTTPFRLTSGLVWYQGSTLRINMFGYADGDDAGPERIVEFFWNGSVWSWGSPSLRTPPSGAGVRTLAATVLQSPAANATYTRLSVFARTGGTANPGATDVGHIWELYFLIENGAQSGWQWADLSYECVPTAFICLIPKDTR